MEYKLTKKECKFCIHYDKKVEEEPCFSCQSTNTKKHFEQSPISTNQKYQDLQHKISEYKILFKKCITLWGKQHDDGLTKEEIKDYLDTQKKRDELKVKISNLLCDKAVWDENIHIIEGVPNGKPRIII